MTASIWSERWQAPHQWLGSLEATLRAKGACVLLGGAQDRWDLKVRGGFFGGARLLMGVEDVGAGQLVRLRVRPHVPARGPVLAVAFAALAFGALRDDAWLAAAVLGLVALLPALRTLEQCTAAMATITRSLRGLRDGDA